MTEMPFILATCAGRTDQDTRKLIRRHVMIGKNRGKKRQPKPKEEPAEYGISTKPDTCKKHRDIMPAPPRSHQDIPGKVGSELSLIRFADAVDPSTITVVLECELTP